MNHGYSIKYDNLLLRPIEKNDLSDLRKWRNDKTNSRFLRKIDYITEFSQKRWFCEYLEDNTSIGFSIVENHDLNRMVGSVFLYNLDFEKNECEFGKILIGDKEAHGRGIGRKATVMILEFGFKVLKVNRIYANINQKNVVANNIYIGIGFQKIGSHPFCQNIEGYEDEIEINQNLLENNNFFVNDIVMLGGKQ